jgi:hypothetical protein
MEQQMKRLLDYNPLTGESVVFEDNQDGTFNLHHIQARAVVDAILDGNKEMANDKELTRRGIKKDWWKYATIPNVIIMKWKKELGVDIFDQNDRKKMFALLNSNDYKFLKTTDAVHAPKT